MAAEHDERGLLQALLRRVLIPKVIGSPPEGYRVFTRDFDLTLSATELALRFGKMSRFDYQEFGRARGLRDQGVFDPGWPKHREDVDTSIRTALSPNDRDQIAVSLLIDQSGSMRDAKITQVALAVDAMQRMLDGLAIPLEVLGFTTVRWKGGEARALWKRRGSPAYPGRLNDLLHVIYLDPNNPGSGDDPAPMVQMLRPALLKENIDGEALEWATGRLKQRSEARKLLVVISDGASVDDSTLTENPADFLERHLLEVITDLQDGGEIELGALGVGHAVDRYYRRSLSVERPEVVCSALATLVRRMLVEPDSRPSVTADDDRGGEA